MRFCPGAAAGGVTLGDGDAVEDEAEGELDGEVVEDGLGETVGVAEAVEVAEGDDETVLVSDGVGEAVSVGAGDTKRVSAIVLTPWIANTKSTAEITSLISLGRCFMRWIFTS